MKRVKYLKQQFKTEAEHILYQKAVILDTCYEYKIDPLDFISEADGDLFMKIGSLMNRIFHKDETYFVGLNALYVNNERLNKFLNEDAELEYHQATVMNYCVNNTLRLTDLKNHNIVDRSFGKEFDSVLKSIEWLEDNNKPLIKKAWEKDLLDWFKEKK
jgi:hypothetical protein